MKPAVVHAIGDSVMQGAGPSVYGTLPDALPGITVDAEPNRQFRQAIALVRTRCSMSPVPDCLIVHLGTNGLFTATSFDTLIATADGIGRLLFVNVRAPRDWVPEVNRRLAAGVERHRGRVALLDWDGVVAAQPDLVHRDGFHMNRRGATTYARLLAAAVSSPLR